MTDTKHNPATAGQDSDDLIAELARLVAQDARTAAAPASDHRPAEPEVSAQPEPEQPAQDDFYQAEPGFGVPQDVPFEGEGETEPTQEAGQSDAMPVFDFGFGTAQRASVDTQEVSGDPIADLIADAEVETYQSDSSRDDDWANHDDPLPAEPEPSYEDYGRSSAAFSDTAPVPHERDPIGDIEALIGEAARANSVDSGLPGGRRVKSSFLDDFETDAAVDAAESAILAAAAATGSSVRRVEPANDPEDWLVAPAPRQIEERPEPAVDPQPRQEQFIPDPLFASPVPPPSEPEAQAAPADYADDDYTDEAYADEAYAEEEPAPRRPRRRLGGFVLPVAAGAVIFALIGGVYFAFFSGPGEPGEAPVLTADASPLKEDAPPQSESTASESVVFSEIEGNGGSPEDEALVSRDQTNGASGAQVAEVLAPEDGETALANRPVRTVTVRPDGTIVQATDSVAGSNVLPVERPDVPAVPNSTLTSDPIGEAIALAMADGETAAASQTEAPAADASEALPEAASTPETADETETGAAATAEDAGAPVPVARPAGLTAQDTTASTPVPASEAPATETVAAVTPTETTPAPAAAAATPAADVGAWVQLSSQRSEADAQADIPSLQARYGTLFNGATPQVSRVDLGERGIYYRVRLPQPSFDQANSVCTAIQGQGGDCFVLNN